MAKSLKIFNTYQKNCFIQLSQNLPKRNEGKVLNTHFDIITFRLMIFYVVNLYTVLLILNNVNELR